jgi:hypothetical protein
MERSFQNNGRGGWSGHGHCRWGSMHDRHRMRRWCACGYVGHQQHPRGMDRRTWIRSIGGYHCAGSTSWKCSNRRGERRNVSSWANQVYGTPRNLESFPKHKQRLCACLADDDPHRSHHGNRWDCDGSRRWGLPPIRGAIVIPAVLLIAAAVLGLMLLSVSLRRVPLWSPTWRMLVPIGFSLFGLGPFIVLRLGILAPTGPRAVIALGYFLLFTIVSTVLLTGKASRVEASKL